MTAPTDVASRRMPSVREAKLSSKQESLLLSLERRVQLRAQAERNAALLHDPATSARSGEFAASVKDFLRQNMHRSTGILPAHETPVENESMRAFAGHLDECVGQWKAVYDHAHKSFGLVEEMEQSHEHVVSKTQALYDSFENILQQVEALTSRVELIAAPMPHFMAIDGIARTLGFGVKFASPSAATSKGTAGENAPGLIQQAVQVFQHKRNIDPTTQAFRDALEQIDVAVTYLEAHKEFKDAECYIEAYRTLTAGAIQCLKDYAISGLDAAKDAVLEAVAKSRVAAGTAPATLDIDETSPYYVHFQLVAPSLSAAAVQLQRLATSSAEAANQTTYMTNVMALADVCNAYVAQRVTLLSPVLATYFETLSQGADIVNLLRVSGSYLVRVCEAEFRLFMKLFGREPSDPLFVFKTTTSEETEDEEEEDTAFDRLIFQLSGSLYNVVRPLMLVQKELESLCEIVQVLQSELIESVITPRAHVVGYVEPVMHRMIQDAQERLILCVQKFIRDEIEGFTPTPADLDYPNKLMGADGTSANLYTTWYPALERTLLCLSKVYHFVNMEIFEELAQDAIQICTASLKMASADLTVAKGPIHGSLFLVKHLLTLREQITPFDIKFSVRAKALDFTNSTDAMSHLLSDVSSVFSLSFENNRLVGLFTQGIPQIQETTSDVKKDVQQELKKSCTGFIDAVLQQLARPLLTLMKQIADLQKANSSAPVDLRRHALAKPENVAKTLAFVTTQLNDSLPQILETIHLYLRNASTETILFKPIQKNLTDAVENLKVLLDQSFTVEERQPCDPSFQRDSVLEEREQLQITGRDERARKAHGRRGLGVPVWDAFVHQKRLGQCKRDRLDIVPTKPAQEQRRLSQREYALLGAKVTARGFCVAPRHAVAPHSSHLACTEVAVCIGVAGQIEPQLLVEHRGIVVVARVAVDQRRVVLDKAVLAQIGQRQVLLGQATEKDLEKIVADVEHIVERRSELLVGNVLAVTRQKSMVGERVNGRTRRAHERRRRPDAARHGGARGAKVLASLEVLPLDRDGGGP